ncbi:MAG: uL15m family ribosomal protein [Candidatus Woesearchaeota archaeon]
MGRKANKFRGQRTNGRGRGKSHNRGSGNRGGFGNAGSGKKGDAKKPSFWKTDRFGKKAFGMHAKSVSTTLNVGDVENRIQKLVLDKKVKAGSEVALNLTELKYDKLLGSGKLTAKVVITVSEASAKAIEKVEAAGGKVILPDSE